MSDKVTVDVEQGESGGIIPMRAQAMALAYSLPFTPENDVEAIRLWLLGLRHLETPYIGSHLGSVSIVRSSDHQ
jgi:hypothetical protein